MTVAHVYLGEDRLAVFPFTSLSIAIPSCRWIAAEDTAVWYTLHTDGRMLVLGDRGRADWLCRDTRTWLRVY